MFEREQVFPEYIVGHIFGTNFFYAHAAAYWLWKDKLILKYYDQVD